MNLLKRITLLSTLVILSAHAEIDANKLVEEADLKRGLGNISHEIKVNITNNKDSKIEGYLVKFKDVKTSLIIQTEPERAKGRKLLLEDYSMWLFTPNIKRPVRISLDQKLTGEVANGDIANTNYASDYDAKFMKSIMNEGKEYYQLDLTAKNKKVTYHRIEYLIEKNGSTPHSATFFAVSGKPLKRAIYTDFKPIKGKSRSTKMIIYDYINKDKFSTIVFSNHNEMKFPDSTFNKDRLEFE